MKNRILMMMMMLSLLTTIAVADNYNINVSSEMTNGVITAAQRAANGSTVTLNVTPADGYYIEASDIVVTRTGNIAQMPTRTGEPDIAIPVTAVKGQITPEGLGNFTFTMPESNVSITATFHAREDISSSCTVTLNVTSPVSYDAAEHKATLTSITYNSNALKSEGDASTVNGLQEYDAAPIYSSADYTNAGTKTVGFTLRGKYKGTASQSYTISKHAITVKAKDQSIPFGGVITSSKEQMELTSGSALVGGHTLTAAAVECTAVEGTTTGIGGKTYPAGDTYNGVLQVVANSVVIKDGDGKDVSANYDVTTTGTGTTGNLTITTYDISNARFESVDATFTYDGHSHTAVVRVYQDAASGGGFISPDQYTLYYYNDTYTESATGPTNVGTYTVKIKATGSDVTGEKDQICTLTINPAVITATADNAEKMYTEDVPELTATYIGFLDDAHEAWLTKGVVTTAADKTSPLGEYEIDFSTQPTMAVANYTVSTVKGTLTVIQLPLDLASVSVADNVKTYNGQEQHPTVTFVNNGVTIPADGNYTLVYRNAAGEESAAIDAGTYTVIARAIDGGSVRGEREVGTLTIQPKAVSNATGDITITAGSPTYDGTAKEPTSLTVKDGSLDVAATNYTATYSNHVSAGSEARVTLTMTGNYTGTVTANYTILPKPVTVKAKAQTIIEGDDISTGEGTATADGLVSGHVLKSVSVSTTETAMGIYPEGIAVGGAWIVAGEEDMTQNYAITYQRGQLIIATQNNDNLTIADITAQQYDGTPRRPSVSISDGATPLTEGTDYDVDYENNVDVGTAKAIVTLKGVRSGTLIKEFTITPRTLTVTANNQTVTYGNTVSSTTADVTVEGLVGSQVLTAVTLTPSGTTSGTHTLTPSVAAVGNDGTDVTANYAISYVAGTLTVNKKKYSDSPGDFTVSGIGSYVYNGQAQQPVPTVKDTENTLSQLLEQDKDYTLSYSDNVNAGTATLTVTLQGNYEGSFIRTFEISRRSVTVYVAAQTIVKGSAPLSSLNFVNLSGQVPGHVISSVTMGYGESYSTDFASVEVGEWQGELGCSSIAIADGDGIDVTSNYDIEQAGGTLTVLAACTSGETLTINGGTTFEYTGSAQTPAVTVKNSSDATLTEGTDYTLIYQGNVEVGTARIIAVGVTFSGALVADFTITKRSVSVKAKNQTVVYGTEVNTDGSQAELIAGNGQQLPHHLGGIMMTVDATATTVGTHTGAITPGNAYIINDEGEDVTKNYTITAYQKGDLTILAKPYSPQTFTVVLADGSYPYKDAPYTPEVTVKDGGKTLTPGQDYTVSYTDNVNAGRATATVHFQGFYTDGTEAATQSFTITKRRVSITPTEQTIVYNSDPIGSTSSNVTAEGLLDSHTLSSVTLTTDKTAAGVYPSGISATAATVKSGNTDVSENYEIVGGYGKLTITQKEYATGGDISIAAIDDKVYTAGAIKPALTVTDKGEELVAGTDYDVSYTDNVNVGTATASVAFKGNYAGSTTLNFRIVQQPVTVTAVNQTIVYGTSILKELNWATLGGQVAGHVLSEATLSTSETEAGVHDDAITVSGAKIMAGEQDVTANYSITYVAGRLTVREKASDQLTVDDIADMNYTGLAVEPTLTVKDGSKVLSKGSDYDVTYENNVNSGTAKAIVDFKGNYSGTLIPVFNILKLSLTVTAKEQTIVYGETAGSEPADVTATGLADNQFITAVTLIPSITEVGEGTLLPTVVAVGGALGDVTANYTIQCQTGKLTIVPKASEKLTASLAPEQFIYNGQAHTPAVTVKDGTAVLTAGQDYDVTYRKNVDAGTADAIITMKGNYDGNIELHFSILPEQVSSLDISGIKEWYPYTGQPVTPMPTVRYGNKTLTAGQDYVLSYQNNVEMGTATLVVTLMNNYSGSAQRSFEIRMEQQPETPGETEEDKGTVNIVVERNDEGEIEVRVTDAEDKPNVVIPETVTGPNGEEYHLTTIDADAFAGKENINDIYITPKYELNIEDPTFGGLATPEKGARVHVYQTLLKTYATGQLKALVDAGLLVTDIGNANRMFTFSNAFNVALPTGVKQYTCRVVDNGIHLYEVNSPVIRNETGVLLIGNPDTRMFTATNQQDTEASYDGNDLRPVMESEHITEVNYAYLLAGNEFHKMNLNNSIPDGKAYLQWPDVTTYASAPAQLMITGQTTGVGPDITAAENDHEDWYDLGGRKLAGKPVSKGVYIHHGKKVVIK